jgi:hypothetical protein
MEYKNYDDIRTPLVISDDVTSVYFYGSIYIPWSQIKFPKNVNMLIISDNFNELINELPGKLEYVQFGRDFNQDISGIKWAQHLMKLCSVIFGNMFNYNIDGILWPRSLNNIELGFNYSYNDIVIRGPVCLSRVSLPRGIRIISSVKVFEISFIDFDYTRYEWPESIKYVSFNSIYRSLDKFYVPDGIVSIRINNIYDISYIVFPRELTTLTLGDNFNQEIDSIRSCTSLRYLDFGAKFNKDISNLPNSIISLKLGKYYDQCYNLHNLHQLNILLLDTMYFDKLGIIFHDSITKIILLKNFNYNIEIKWPKYIKEILDHTNKLKITNIPTNCIVHHIKDF